MKTVAKKMSVTQALNLSNEVSDMLREQRNALALALDNILAFEDEAHPRHEAVVESLADELVSDERTIDGANARRILRERAALALNEPGIVGFLKKAGA